MDVVVSGLHSELGGVVARHAEARTRRRGGPRVVLNVALQAPNSLLHDGNSWKRHPASRLVADTNDALRDARGADFLVHASYLFIGVAEASRPVSPRLLRIFDAALAAEDLVLRSGVPSCVVRLGYLYGPESRNLRAYRRAFRIGRPYWSGPSSVKQRFLHTDDAAAALLAAATQRAAGRIFVVADDQAVPFTTFMDHFAHLVGNRLPLHIPRFASPAVRFVADEHKQMTELDSGAVDATPRPRGFQPAFPTYRSGLRAVVDAWKA